MDTFLLAARATQDARRIAVVSRDGDVAVWQVRPRRQIARVQIPGTHPLQHPTTQIALDPSGELLAVGGNDGRVHVWRLEPFELVFVDTPTPPGTTRRLPSEQSIRYAGVTPASVVALSADARTLAVGTSHMVMLWDARSGERLDSLWLPMGSETTPSPIQQLAFSPNDGSLIIGATDGWLYGVSPPRWQVEWKLGPGTGQPGLLVVDPTGYQFVVAGIADSTVRLINGATRVEACRFVAPFVQAASFSRNAHALALGDGRSSVQVVDARECRPLARYREFAGSVVGVWFESGCRSVIVALNVSPVLYERRTGTSVAAC